MSRCATTHFLAARPGSIAGTIAAGIAMVITAWVLTPTAAAQEPEVLVELTRPRVFEGESVRYYVALNNCRDDDKPKLADIDGLTIQQGSVSITRQTIFDGFKTVSIGGPRYEFILTPQRAGTFKIPGPTVVVDGKTYHGDERTLRVLPPNEQDLAVVRVSADRTALYPLQSFRIRVTVAVKGLPEPFEDDEPLDGLRQTPVLIIPWADDDQLPDGISADIPAARWLSSYLEEDRSAGFGINNVRFRSSDLFSLFTEQQRAVFRAEPQRVKRKDSRGVTVDYWEYTFEREFTAEKLGKYSFGPITLKGAFAVRTGSDGRSELAEVYAIAKPVEIQVRDVPQQGRPDSYIGAIGNFNIAGELTPTRVKVGDPMTLTLTLRGSGSLENVTPPQLDQVPRIGEHFKLYEATEEPAEGEKRFIYRLRPLTAGLTEFPAVEVSYFDPRNERFQTVRTQPVSIQVAEAERLAPADIAVAPAAVPRPPTVESAAGGLFANITDLRRVRDQRVDPRVWLGSLATMAAIFVVAVAVRWRSESLRNQPEQVRRRGASRRAETQLADAQRLYAAGSKSAATDALRLAVTGLVADAISGNEAALTPRDVVEQLHADDVPEQFTRRCGQFLEELDAARYGATGQSFDRLHASATQLVADLIGHWRQNKRIG